MKRIGLNDVKDISFRIAQKYREYGEPIPDFDTSNEGVLESCLRTPFAKFSKKSLYPTLISKASILFYLIIKNHPFQNGNKRIAITTTQLFLFKNKKWLDVEEGTLYNFTIWVAQSLAELKDPVVDCIEYFFTKHLVKRDY